MFELHERVNSPRHGKLTLCLNKYTDWLQVASSCDRLDYGSDDNVSFAAIRVSLVRCGLRRLDFACRVRPLGR